MPAPRTGILAGGNWIIDHVKMVDRYPAQDALATILSEHRGTGGTPYNVLLDLARLGAGFPLAGAGLVGDDADGRAIREDCCAHGIDATRLRTCATAGTSYTDVMTVQGSGRRTFFHHRGANALLAESDIDLASSDARIFLLGYLLLLDRLDEPDAAGVTGAARVLERARALGFRTAVDMVSEDGDRFATVVRPALPHVDHLIVNEFEASRTTDIAVMTDGAVDPRRVRKAAEALLAAGVRSWVVIHWSQGALAMGADGVVAVQGSVRLPDGAIAGTAGAGDAFAAGLLLGLHDGWPITACLRLAVCAAASSLSHPTCTGGVQDRVSCLELGERYGFIDVGMPS